MTNLEHSGKVSEVWKHLVLLEVVSALAPDWYAETNAGAASYPLADDGERRFGVRGFLRWASGDPMLRNSRYYAHLERLRSGGKSDTYLGSPGFVLNELGDSARYVLCDTDPDCVDDLGRFAARAGLDTRVEVVPTDGMSAVAERVSGRDYGRWFVFIDPFDHHARIAGGPSSVELAVHLLRVGVPIACWYGYDEPHHRFWLPDLIGRDAPGQLWAGDILTVNHDGSTQPDGFLGDATTPGTGSGMAVGNISNELADRLEGLGIRLQDAYTQSVLPSGRPGGLDFRACWV